MENSGFDRPRWPLPLFLFASMAFLYLQLFILPDTPILLANDTMIFLQDARAMLARRICSKDWPQDCERLWSGAAIAFRHSVGQVYGNDLTPRTTQFDGRGPIQNFPLPGRAA